MRIFWRDWEAVSIPDPDSKNLPDFELVSFEFVKLLLKKSVIFSGIEMIPLFILQDCGTSWKLNSHLDVFMATMYFK